MRVRTVHMEDITKWDYVTDNGMWCWNYTGHLVTLSDAILSGQEIYKFSGRDLFELNRRWQRGTNRWCPIEITR